MAPDSSSFVLEPLKPGDSVTGFSIGTPEALALKTFFQKDAKRFQANSIARTYVLRATKDPKILAYLTLVCGEIATEDGDGLAEDADPFQYPTYPAIKIARLLVDARQRGKEIGRTLVDFAVGTAKEAICPAVGCRFVVVDAKAGSIGFYEKCGFTMLDTEANRARRAPVMFIDLHRGAKG